MTDSKFEIPVRSAAEIMADRERNIAQRLPDGWALDKHCKGRLCGPGGVTVRYDGENIIGSVLGVDWRIPNGIFTAVFRLYYGPPEAEGAAK